MTEYEKKLLDMIRDYDDHGKSLEIAVDVILKHLAQLGSSEGQAPVVPSEPS